MNLRNGHFSFSWSGPYCCERWQYKSQLIKQCKNPQTGHRVKPKYKADPSWKVTLNSNHTSVKETFPETFPFSFLGKEPLAKNSLILRVVLRKENRDLARGVPLHSTCVGLWCESVFSGVQWWETECSAHWQEVQQKCSSTHVFGTFFSFPHAQSIWPLWWARVQWKKMIPNCQVKLAVKRMLCLVSMRWLANFGLSLKILATSTPCRNKYVGWMSRQYFSHFGDSSSCQLMRKKFWLLIFLQQRGTNVVNFNSHWHAQQAHTFGKNSGLKLSSLQGCPVSK